MPKDIVYESCSNKVGEALGPDVMKSVKHLIPDILAALPLLLYQGTALSLNTHLFMATFSTCLSFDSLHSFCFCDAVPGRQLNSSWTRGQHKVVTLRMASFDLWLPLYGFSYSFAD